MKSFANNLREAMNKNNYVAKDVAELLGVSPSTVTHWAKGRRFPQTEAHIRELSELLHSKIGELFGEDASQINNNFSMLPFYNIVSGAGSLGFVPEILESTRIPVANKLLGNADIDFLHIVRVSGDSMEPTISNDDWLIVDMISNGEKTRVFKKEFGLYLINMDGYIQVKRLRFKGVRGVDIISDNDIYPMENTINDGIELEVLGKVFKHIKDLGSLVITELS